MPDSLLLDENANRFDQAVNSLVAGGDDRPLVQSSRYRAVGHDWAHAGQDARTAVFITSAQRFEWGSPVGGVAPRS